ncbi:MAG: CCA tRNA nucleotidyltransferase [Flavobacteriaceae bacterium]
MSPNIYCVEALNHPVFKTLSQVAQKLDLECYVIGGYVRDHLLKRTGSKDIDIVAVGDGIALAQALADALPGASEVSVFKNYGTAMLHYQDITLEFVGARKESYTHNSRNPKVAPGSLADDQNRRDFTINALALSLDQNRWGALVDPFTGVDHLSAKLLITPLDPQVTFSDDPLRMMRAIRFAAQLDFTIDPQAWQSIKNQAERIKIIAPERIVDEMNKIMSTPKPSRGLALMYEAGLLDIILPEVTALLGVEEIEGQRHKDNFWHTLEVVDNISRTTDKLWLRWAALLHDIGKAPTKRFDPKIGWTFHGHEFLGGKMVHKLFKRLHMPLNEKVKYVQKLVAMSSRPIIIAEDFVTDSAVRRLVFDASEDLEDLMILCEADITTKNPKKQKRYLQNFATVRQKVAEVEQRDHLRNFQPPVDGAEIMETFGIGPSPFIGQIKETIKEAILEGEIPNQKEAARALMLKKGISLGLTPINTTL